MNDESARSADPAQVARADGFDLVGDAADQADRLAMIMTAEATHNALNGGGGEGDSEIPYPLEDLEDVLAMEDAEDASDDPLHAGGLNPTPWLTAEQAAMHIVDPDDPDDAAYLSDETDEERADPFHDQYEGPAADLTPEDETLLGIDPYDDPPRRG